MSLASWFANLEIEAKAELDKLGAEAEAIVEESVALAQPAVLVLTGRIGEPVAGEGEVASQCGQCIVAGIVVAVEADWLLYCCGERRVVDGRRCSLLCTTSDAQE